MKPEELKEMLDIVEEYKPAFDIIVDTYGIDAEDYMTRLMLSIARISGSYRRELEKEGFTNEQAFQILLNTKEDIYRSLNGRKT